MKSLPLIFISIASFCFVVLNAYLFKLIGLNLGVIIGLIIMTSSLVAAFAFWFKQEQAIKQQLETENNDKTAQMFALSASLLEIKENKNISQNLQIEGNFVDFIQDSLNQLFAHIRHHIQLSRSKHQKITLAQKAQYKELTDLFQELTECHHMILQNKVTPNPIYSACAKMLNDVIQSLLKEQEAHLNLSPLDRDLGLFLNNNPTAVNIMKEKIQQVVLAHKMEHLTALRQILASLVISLEHEAVNQKESIAIIKQHQENLKAILVQMRSILEQIAKNDALHQDIQNQFNEFHI